MEGPLLRLLISMPEMRASLRLARIFFFGASKKLVTGPNGIMVAQTFCDILFMKKRHQISIYKQFLD